MSEIKTCIFPPIVDDDITRDGGAWPEYCHTILICVDSFKNKLTVGRIYTYCNSDVRHFYSMDQMLFEIESILDKNGLAQQWCQYRTVLTSNLKEKSEPDVHRSIRRKPAIPPGQLRVVWGKLVSFQLRVYSRQNASMQGILELVEGQRVSFRSALELIHVVREAVESMSESTT